MSHLFSTVLNMSMTGSIVILLVMFARLILKRTPKIFSYALWSVVLFRLLCPVAFTAPVSALNALAPEVQEASELTSIVYYLPAELKKESNFTFIPAENQSGNQIEQPEPVSHTELDIMQVASYVWIAGTVVMLLYSVIQYIRLRLKLVGAMAYSGNVYCADYIDTPFVMGILSPKIYLPSDVPTKERKYIIAHERHHIRRFDHIIKLLAYFALCIHWFNPIVWAAFILAGKDMEMSCDEAVIRKLGSQIRADYSASLLRLSTHKKIIAGIPLAFGEGDTKGRVMNMAKWKKPKLWVSLICLLLCTTIMVACAVNPETAGSIGGMNTTKITGEITCANRLNIRKEPNSLSAVVGNYINGTIVTILETKNGWGRTDKGWISMDYVTTPNEETIALEDTRMDGPVSVSLDKFCFALPEGLSIRSVSEEYLGYVFYSVEGEVGGIALRRQEQTNSPDSFSQDWQAAIGVPEASNPTMGYMGGGSIYGDYEITYFPDMPVNRDDNGNIIQDEIGTYVLENEVTHYFFFNGTDVYDLWFYSNRFPNIMRETLLKSCYIEGVTDIAAMQSALTVEKDALEQCRTVLEEIQSSGAYKIETKQHNGASALNETSIITVWGSGENRLHICLIPESGGSSTFGGLLVDGVRYECDSMREWREITWWDWQDPWLTSFQWDESVIAYQDTMTDESGITVMLRIDQPFAVGKNEQPHYFVNFNFDADSTFRNVYVQANVFMNNAITKTESIVSLDPETVNAEIQKEYQRAIG